MSEHRSLEPLGSAIHVWLTDPDQIYETALLARYRELLCPAELQREQRFLFAADRHRFLVSHALLRTVLSCYAPVAPEEWQFETNRWGRPELRGGPARGRLRFNLSHTTALAAVAVTLERDIGIDVEDCRRRIDLAVADRYFAPPEVEQLRRMPAEQQPDAFLQFWTLKEAYIKARGIGLSLGLKGFWFRLPDVNEPASAQQPIEVGFDTQLGDDPGNWQFVRYHVATHHRLAIAVRRDTGTELQVHFYQTVPLDGKVRRLE